MSTQVVDDDDYFAAVRTISKHTFTSARTAESTFAAVRKTGLPNVLVRLAACLARISHARTPYALKADRVRNLQNANMWFGRPP